MTWLFPFRKPDPHTTESNGFVTVKVDPFNRGAPASRPIPRWVWLAAAIAIAGIYVAIRLSSALVIDQPLATREGFRQRAAAAQKAISYRDRVGDTRHVVERVFLWPVEPTETEYRAAEEFASLALDHYALLKGRGLLCNTYTEWSYPHGLSSDQRAMVKAVAAYILRPSIDWHEPLPAMMDAPITQAFRCEGKSPPLPR